LHAERPVRVTRRETAVCGDLVQVVGVDHLEDRFVEIEPIIARMLLDLLFEDAQIRRQVRVDESVHCCWSTTRNCYLSKLCLRQDSNTRVFPSQTPIRPVQALLL